MDKFTKITTLTPVLFLVVSGGIFYFLRDTRFVFLYNGETLYNPYFYEHKITDPKLKAYETEIKNFSEKFIQVPTTEDKAAGTIKTISNYSVKLISECLSAGTGWFLDYEIPTNENSYPTKWFVATNAHVANAFKFSENPYKQIVPSNWDYCVRSNLWGSNLFLVKERLEDKPKGYTNVEFSAEFNSLDAAERIIRQCSADARTQTTSNNNIFYTKIRDPKLFYVPTNFLGNRYAANKYAVKWNQINYMKDFAVIEVDFETENEAKTLTDNFYNKIKDKSFKEINLFADEIMKSKSSDEILENKEDYFAAGYSGSKTNGNVQLSIEGNYFSKSGITATKEAGKFGVKIVDDLSIKNKYGKPIHGHMDTSQIKIFLDWNKKQYIEWGYMYALSNMHGARPGISGSLVIDSNNNALGLLSRGTHDHILVTPLRSEGILHDSKIFMPNYDFIKGSKGQIGSYKEQLDKYYPNLKTRLREKKWKYI